jgi:hypothetical protein
MAAVDPGADVGAGSGDTSDQIQFAIQFSKFRNSENYQLSEKSPKTKVVEELYTYNFPKGRHMF